MNTPTLVAFLKTALKVQSPPYSGIRAVDGALLASDGYRMVAYIPKNEFIQGEGVIEPVNVKALLAYAEGTYITQIRVNGGAIEFDATFESIDAPSGYARKSETVRLIAFDSRNMRLETVLPNLKPPKARLVASDVRIKKLRDFDTPDKEKVVFDEHATSFRAATDEDTFRYSAKQVREALSFLYPFSVNVWIGAKRELVLEAFGFLYAVTPFVIRLD